MTTDVHKLGVGAPLLDAFAVYRLLFKRSVTAAAVVFGALALIHLAHHAASGGVAELIAVVGFVAQFGGPLLVQGALVAIVREVHEGRPPRRIDALFAVSWERFWPLLGASVLYGVVVGLGVILLIVPGLIIGARWSLLAPLVVLERLGVFDAADRSAKLVKGQTARVIVILGIAYVAAGMLPLGIYFAHWSFGTTVFVNFVYSSIAAPYDAHLMSVIYYRLVDPERPVIHPDVRQWQSVWTGR